MKLGARCIVGDHLLACVCRSCKTTCTTLLPTSCGPGKRSGRGRARIPKQSRRFLQNTLTSSRRKTRGAGAGEEHDGLFFYWWCALHGHPCAPLAATFHRPPCLSILSHGVSLCVVSAAWVQGGLASLDILLKNRERQPCLRPRRRRRFVPQKNCMLRTVVGLRLLSCARCPQCWGSL